MSGGRPIALGYRRRPRSLRPPSTERTSIIALLVSDVTNPFYNEIIGGAEAAAADADYTMLLANTRGSADIERAAPGAGTAGRGRRCPCHDAHVGLHDPGDREAAPGGRPESSGQRRAEHRHRQPVRGAPGGAAPRRAGPSHASPTWRARRARGPTGCDGGPCARLPGNLQLQTRRIGPFQPSVAGGVEAAEELNRHRRTAVIAYNDRMAIGLIRGLTALGVADPRTTSASSASTTSFLPSW